MTVGYKVDIDDIVEVYQRAFERSKAWSRQVKRNRIINVIFGAINAFVFFNIFVTELDIDYTTMTFVLNVFVTLAIPTLIGLYWLKIEKWFLKRRVRRVVGEYFKGNGSVDFHVTVSDTGLATSLFDTDTKHAWTSIETVDVLENHIEIRTIMESLIFVRNRAFATNEEKQRFINLLQHHSQLQPNLKKL